MCVVTLFLSATKTLHVCSFDYQFLQLTGVWEMLQSCGPWTVCAQSLWDVTDLVLHFTHSLGDRKMHLPTTYIQ